MADVKQQMVHNGYTITNNGRSFTIKGIAITFFSFNEAKNYIDKILCQA